MKRLLLLGMMFSATAANAQEATRAFSISGTAGIGYEGYHLSKRPAGWTGFMARRPESQFRFYFIPLLSFGKNFSVPLNFNFTTKPTNFAGPYAGVKNQSLGDFITNPGNNFAINPRYKWAELQLGTQYLKYSDLSTGDIGIFGAGVDLRPKTYRIRFFAGTSQQGIDYVALPLPGTTGAYKRTHWMVQLGKEREGKYAVAFNFSKGADHRSSVGAPPVAILPQEGFTASIVANVFFGTGWFVKSEVAESYFTKDLAQPVSPALNNSFKPFIDGRTSTSKDWAAQASIGRRSRNFDLSYATKYIGAGFQTTGYPYLQPDKWDNTLQTRFNAWKNRINVVASVGTRTNNLSNTALSANQFIANVNWLTQFNERFSTNLTYNNFGFTAASGTNPYGIRNVSNDLGLSATYTWNTAKMTNLLTGSVNISKYDERDVISGLVTTNNTYSALLSYVPSFFKSQVQPDLSVVYFTNRLPTIRNTLVTVSAGVATPALRKKMQVRGQLQYAMGKLDQYTPNQNIIVTGQADYRLTKKLGWTVYVGTNYFRYGNEIVPPGARYNELTYRTSLNYKF
jgi:hypothetical protein